MTDIDSYINTIEDKEILNTNNEKLKQYNIDAHYLILNMCNEYPQPVNNPTKCVYQYTYYSIMIIIIIILFIILAIRLRG